MTQVMIYSTSVGCSTSQMNCTVGLSDIIFIRQHKTRGGNTDLDPKARAEECGKVANALEHLEPLVQFTDPEVGTEESVLLPAGHNVSSLLPAVVRQMRGDIPKDTTDAICYDGEQDTSDRNDTDEDGGQDVEWNGEDLVGRGIGVDLLQ